MSKIAVDNVTPSAGGTVISLIRGLAKAWVLFNGTGTIAIDDSENVSSLTDDGAGQYRYDLTNAMANADYSNFANGSPDFIGTTNRCPISFGSTSSQILIGMRTTSNGDVDAENMNGAVYGDLA